MSNVVEMKSIFPGMRQFRLVEEDIHEFREILMWCKERYGPAARMPRTTDISIIWTHWAALQEILVIDDHRAFEFKMRWC